MKKLIFIAGLVIATTLMYAGVASANAGPHGGYSNPLTDACAGCHRAHTALGASLLMKANVYELCIMCHGTGGSSVLNVQTGQHSTYTERLNGGGFETILGSSVSSAHTVEGLAGSDGIAKAYGSDGGDGAGVQGTLECTSCHNPHGSTNYRILKDGDNGYPYGISGFTAHRWVPNNTYLLNWTDENGLLPDGTPMTTGDPVAVLMGQNYTVLEAGTTVSRTVGTSKYTADNGNYSQGIIRFCATCHKQYWTVSGSGEVDSSSSSKYMYPGMQTWAGDATGNTYRYRHAISRTYSASSTSLPVRFSVATWFNDSTLSTTTTRSGFTCLTCHFAHGTTAAATGYADDGPSADSALLYFDQRGVCRSCHWKTK